MKLQTKVEIGGIWRDVTVIRADGTIDNVTSRSLNEVLSGLLAENHYKIVLDLSQVDYISSSGWGVFVGEIRRIRDNQGDLKLAGLVPEVEEIYRLLEFYTILKAYPTVEDAVKNF